MTGFIFIIVRFIYCKLYIHIDFPELKFLGYQGLSHEQLRLTVSNDTDIFVLQKSGNLSWESMKMPKDEEKLRICLTTAYQTKSRIYAVSENLDAICILYF